MNYPINNEKESNKFLNLISNTIKIKQKYKLITSCLEKPINTILMSNNLYKIIIETIKLLNIDMLDNNQYTDIILHIDIDKKILSKVIIALIDSLLVLLIVQSNIIIREKPFYIKESKSMITLLLNKLDNLFKAKYNSCNINNTINKKQISNINIINNNKDTNDLNFDILSINDNKNIKNISLIDVGLYKGIKKKDIKKLLDSKYGSGVVFNLTKEANNNYNIKQDQNLEFYNSCLVFKKLINIKIYPDVNNIIKQVYQTCLLSNNYYQEIQKHLFDNELNMNSEIKVDQNHIDYNNNDFNKLAFNLYKIYNVAKEVLYFLNTNENYINNQSYKLFLNKNSLSNPSESKINKSNIITSKLNTVSFTKTSHKINNFNIETNKRKNTSTNIINLIPKEPYLPPIVNSTNSINSDLLNNKLTLVLDLDETLIHSFAGEKAFCILLRPNVIDFLNRMKDIFEIGIFTSSASDYADNILDNYLNCIDFDFRLYRQHVTSNSTYDNKLKKIITNKVKDLSKLGRDLNKVILIDNYIPNFLLQPDNSLYIKTWENDIFDNQLKGLANILEYINYANIDDVREIIRIIKKDYIEYSLINKCNNPYDNITKEDKLKIKNIINNKNK